MAGLYTLVSIAGLALVVWGYGLASAHHVVVWTPPVWGRHVAALVTIPAFVLIAAAYVPGNRIKAALGHPMLAGHAEGVDPNTLRDEAKG